MNIAHAQILTLAAGAACSDGSSVFYRGRIGRIGRIVDLIGLIGLIGLIEEF